MANPSKERGTRFETAVARYLRAELGDPRIERRALHGARDMGDLHGIRAHGWEGIAECKAHRRMAPGLVEAWREQALAERGNADADFVLLVVKAWQRSVSQAECHVTLADLARIAGPGRFPAAAAGGHMDDAWVRMDLSEAARLIREFE